MTWRTISSCRPSHSASPEQDWFSRGGITLQPNLVNTTVTYLERDEPAHALRAFYNAFAVGYYPDVNAFTEWEPSFGKSGGPFFKTSDEAGSLAWLRLMLVREDGDKLYLASGAPRRWFAPIRRSRSKARPHSSAQSPSGSNLTRTKGHVDATVRLPDSFRAKEIRLRLRHPDGKHFTRVEMDGQPWTQFDSAHEWITVPVSAGTKNIRAFF